MDKKINYFRWLDVIFLSLMSYALIHLIASLQVVQVALNSWVSLFTSLHFAVQALLGLAGFSLALYILKYFNVIHKNHLKNPCLFLYCPPITVSIFLSLLCLSLHLDLALFFSNVFLNNYLLISVSLFSSLLFVLCVWDFCNRKHSKESPSAGTIVIDTHAWIKDESLKAHFRWLTTERSIAGLDEDKFGRDAYVERIRELFKERNRAVHVAIVGPFGIGKTSLWKCVERELGEEFIFVAVDGWARSDKTAAAQIIDEMVAALSTYVDCASIRDVPREYMDALAGVDFQGVSFLAKILSLHNHQSPMKLIGKINSILEAIGKTIVVVLEDFDRNPNSENSMNDVAGLLDRLRHFNSISFLVCLAPGVKSHVLSRISSHREDILGFDSKKSIADVVDLMLCYAKHANVEVIGVSEDRTNDIAQLINGIIKTPRELKYALRRSISAWQSLSGEVNAYDLLVINVLRYSAPEVLDFLLSNFKAFQSGVPDVNAPNELKDELLQLIPQGKIDNRTLHSLVKFIFPAWNGKDGISIRSGLQRVNGWWGYGYLKRIIEERVLGDSDIDFIERIKGLSLIDDKAFDSIVSSSENSRKFIDFSGGSVDGYYQLISEPIFYRYLIAKFKMGKDIYGREGSDSDADKTRYIVRKYLVDGDKYFSNFVEFLIGENVCVTYDFCIEYAGMNKLFVKLFLQKYSNSGAKVFFRAFPDNKDQKLDEIYKLTKVSEGERIAFLKIVFREFICEPDFFLRSVFNIVNEYSLNQSPSKEENLLWLNGKDDLLKVFKSIDFDSVTYLSPEMVNGKIFFLENMGELSDSDTLGS